MSGLDHLVMKTREAAGGHLDDLSIGEALAAALVLNRADWLAKMGYTIAQALERIGSEWAGMIPAAAQIIHTTNETLAQANASATAETTLANWVRSEGEVDLTADLVTYAHAPGYRDVRFIFDVRRPGGSTKYRLGVQVNAKDSAAMAMHTLEVHRLAWNGKNPIDLQPGETRPPWMDWYEELATK